MRQKEVMPIVIGKISDIPREEEYKKGTHTRMNMEIDKSQITERLQEYIHRVPLQPVNISGNCQITKCVAQQLVTMGKNGRDEREKKMQLVQISRELTGQSQL